LGCRGSKLGYGNLPCASMAAFARAQIALARAMNEGSRVVATVLGIETTGGGEVDDAAVVALLLLFELPQAATPTASTTLVAANAR